MTTRSKAEQPAARTARRHAPRAQPGALPPARALAANHLGVLWTTLEATLAPAFGDLSGASAGLLLWLQHWSPVGVVELARVVGLSQPACTRAVDKLVQQGLVRRGPASGKEVPLELTAAGRNAAARLQAGRLAACDRLLAALAPAERTQLLGLVHKLLRAPVTDRAWARHVCRYCDHGVCDGPACPVGCRATEIEAGPGRRS